MDCRVRSVNFKFQFTAQCAEPIRYGLRCKLTGDPLDYSCGGKCKILLANKGRYTLKNNLKSVAFYPQCGPGGVLRGGGFVCGSKQLKPSPKLTSLLTFLFSDKKVRPPAGYQPYSTLNSLHPTKKQELIMLSLEPNKNNSKLLENT